MKQQGGFKWSEKIQSRTLLPLLHFLDENTCIVWVQPSAYMLHRLGPALCPRAAAAADERREQLYTALGDYILLQGQCWTP